MNKQDEEKAKSLWYHFCTEESCEGHVDCKLCPKAQVHHQLMEMVSWKEQQMIEKAVEYINNTIGQGGWLNSCQINNFIEDFKKYMEN